MTNLIMEVSRDNYSEKRRESAEIEDKLHPVITIGGKIIQHRHVGKKIIFSAFEGLTPFNNREFCITRDTVLASDDFYKEYKDELSWLVEIGLIQEKLNQGE
jgi:hypothetical protein